MVRYSPDAAAALAFLKRPYNDVDIFVEDTANPNMWLYIVRKLLPTQTYITSVNAIGDRGAVIAACRQDQKCTQRRRIYIIDGDLGILQGKRAPKLKHIYQLKAYCVENLLLQEGAILKSASIMKPNESEAGIHRKLAFNSFLERERSQLLPLFTIYAVCNKIEKSISTVGLGIQGLFENTSQGPRICRQKALKRMSALRKSAIDIAGLGAYRLIRSKISKTVLRLELAGAVSGKDYTLPLLHKRVSALFGQKYSYEQWKVQLATYWDGKGDAGLAKRLAKI